MPQTERESSRTLALIHTVAGLIPVFETLAARALPGWSSFAMLDESLLGATIREGRLMPLTKRRLAGQVWSAVDAGATAVVVTCSTLGGAVDALRPFCPVPMFRIDEGMAVEAVKRGQRIGVLATLTTTLEPTTELIRRTAVRAGTGNATVLARLADGAFARLKAGDAAGHDDLVAESLRALAAEADVIVLAQASMARAVTRLGDALGPLPVLTSPELGMAHVRAALSG
jgi:Asp/Glu/hydantoin racemase